jgi:hypothetical protein
MPAQDEEGDDLDRRIPSSSSQALLKMEDPSMASASTSPTAHQVS